MTRHLQKIQETSAHEPVISCATLGKRTGRMIATGGADGLVKLWSTTKTKNIMTLTDLQKGNVTCVAFNGNEDLLAATSSTGCFKLWDLHRGQVVRTFDQVSALSGEDVRMEFHPYGNFLASCAGNHLKLWDVRRKECIQTYNGHLSSILSIRFSPDGQWVVSGGQEGLTKIWDLTAGKLLHNLSPNSSQTTIGGGGGHHHHEAIRSIAFHPDEFFLATGNGQGVIRVWDLDSFTATSTISKTAGSVCSLLFTPDGTSLVSSHSEGGVNMVTRWPDFVRPPIALFAADPSSPAVGGSAGDLHILPSTNQLLSCSLSKDKFSIWFLDLKNVTAATIPQEDVLQTKPITHAQLPSSQPTKTVSSSSSVHPIISDFSPQQQHPQQEQSSTDKQESVGAISNTHQQTSCNAGNDAPPVVTPLLQPDRQKPIGLSIEAFLDQSGGGAGAPLSETNLLESVLHQHQDQMSVLSSRLSRTRAIKALWNRGDRTTALLQMAKMNDAGVCADVLHVLLGLEGRQAVLSGGGAGEQEGGNGNGADKWKQVLTLEVCALLLPVLQKLMSSPFEDYIIEGIAALHVLVVYFLDQEATGSGKSRSPRDHHTTTANLVAEERSSKREECLQLFLQTKPRLEELSRSKGAYSTPLVRSSSKVLQAGQPLWSLLPSPSSSSSSALSHRP
ncbi:Katanin p80 WD40 repeat-containing subunit B1 [Balamuthia mandrillaris]